MKKLTFIVIMMISMACLINAQNPEWLNFTNGDYITALAEEGNLIWVGTTGGLVQVDKDTGIPVFYNKANSGLPGNNVRSIAIDVNGMKWIGTWNDGMASFDGTNWTVYNTSNSGLPHNDINSIVVDVDGLKWIGTYNDGLAAFDGTNWKVVLYQEVTKNSLSYNVSQFPDGLYFIRLKTSKGVEVKKLVIH
ncbi:MAG: T9SS type A sorting domain-containing protein [Bacteroidales bacterium]|nr:T9SS type A sorting domain-containing protein [Bacteroidales bacterium]MCF8345694.1 T9SS type A sorting domain-containing protein [Bacteroidales bacterium]